MDEVVAGAAHAAAGSTDGGSLAVGGSRLPGIPRTLLSALHEQGSSPPPARDPIARSAPTGGSR